MPQLRAEEAKSVSPNLVIMPRSGECPQPRLKQRPTAPHANHDDEPRTVLSVQAGLHCPMGCYLTPRLRQAYAKLAPNRDVQNPERQVAARLCFSAARSRHANLATSRRCQRNILILRAMRRGMAEIVQTCPWKRWSWGWQLPCCQLRRTTTHITYTHKHTHTHTRTHTHTNTHTQK